MRSAFTMFPFQQKKQIQTQIEQKLKLEEKKRIKEGAFKRNFWVKCKIGPKINFSLHFLYDVQNDPFGVYFN